MKTLERIGVGTAVLLAAAAFAQPPAIDWYTIDGGGGSSSGGAFLLMGTIGQPDAGAMSGGPFTLTGGFWVGGAGGGPSCDPDVNCDGSVDGFDIETMEQAVGGDLTNFCQADADFNRDGSVDGFDVESVEQVVGGAPCP